MVIKTIPIFLIFFFRGALIIDLSTCCDLMNKVLTLVKVSVLTARRGKIRKFPTPGVEPGPPG